MISSRRQLIKFFHASKPYTYQRPLFLGLQSPCTTRMFTSSRQSRDPDASLSARSESAQPFASQNELKDLDVHISAGSVFSKHTDKTDAVFPHPVYTSTQVRDKIFVAHRAPRDWPDWVAHKAVRLLRWGTDIATGYQHHVEEPKMIGDIDPQSKTKPYNMTEEKWLTRFVFLESVAGVPGMVAGMLRHLHSLRRLKNDNGWIETLLEEAYNERMHLLTFLKLTEPGIVMKIFILGAQGVFFNSLFLAYLVSPRTCHRFVAYLEEEAVLTYSLAIQDLENGRLPKWETLQAPDMAIKYWELPEGERFMKDLLLRVRADEAKHREVNHTLGNLDQEQDRNPFTAPYSDSTIPRPSKGIEHIKPLGWERNDVVGQGR